MSLAVPPEARILYATINQHRRNGLTDEQVAAEVGLHPTAVAAIPLPRPQPSRQRAVQHQQLMAMAQALMPRVEKGDVEAIPLMLKVMQREANLLGLDAPKEVISHNYNTDSGLDGLTADQLRELPTLEIKRRLLQMAAHNAIDVTPEAADPPESGG